LGWFQYNGEGVRVRLSGTDFRVGVASRRGRYQTDGIDEMIGVNPIDATINAESLHLFVGRDIPQQLDSASRLSRGKRGDRHGNRRLDIDLRFAVGRDRRSVYTKAASGGVYD
jgi:hypothetical protein